MAKLVTGAAGFKAWLIEFVVENLFDHVAKPIILTAIRKGQLYYDKAQGKIIASKIRQADDIDDFRDARDKL